MRIIGGELGGRRLSAPKGSETRPTSDRVRESLFAILGPPEPDAEILDLFAGSGTLGLEALSRGAAGAVFVEASSSAAKVLRANIDSLGLATRTRVMTAKIPAALTRRELAARQFDWVFVDPPYASALGLQTLAALADGALLSADGLVVLEHDRRRPPDREVGCLVRTDARRYGDTELSFFRRGNP